MLISLLAIIGGELALYLHKLGEFMICPRYVGKGFVDKNDITRLGMEGGGVKDIVDIAMEKEKLMLAIQKG